MSSSSPRREAAPGWGPRLAKAAIAIAAIVLVGGLALVQAIRELGTRPGGQMQAPTGPLSYRHPSGAFEIFLPPGWTVRERDVDRDAGELAFVVFRAPDELELWVRLRDLGHDRPERLITELRDRAEQMGLPVEPVVTNLGGRVAFVRRLGIYQNEILTVDFLVGTTNHHLQFAAPKGRLDVWEPVWRALLDGYQPSPAAP